MRRLWANAALLLMLNSCFDDKVTMVDSGGGGAVTVAIVAVDATASESGDPGTFAITRAGDASQALTVNFTVAGTATDGVDFATLGTSVTLPAGASIAFLTVAPIADGAVEGDETVLVTLAAGAGYTVGSPASATVTILDNVGSTPVVTVTAVDANASETGDTGSFAVMRAGDPSAALTVNLTVGGTATAATDYTALPASIVIPAGSFLVILPVTPIADSLVEGDETVIVTVAAGAGYTVGTASSATVTISDGPPLSYSTPETPAGVSGIDNAALAADLGSDKQPRLVYFRGNNLGSDNTQIRLVRRRPDGTWTTPVPVSANNTDYKTSTFMAVSRNNDFIHVFWIQTPSSVSDPLLHYAQFDAGDPPVATVSDTVVSSGAVANLSGGAILGDVPSFAAVIDRSTNNVAAVWMQDVSDGSSGTIPIVGVVAAGSGNFGEKVALVSPPVN